MMSRKDLVPTSQVIPRIETGIFDGDDDSIIALLRVRPEDVVSGSNAIALGYAQLRANVYIDQRAILDPELRRSDGGEHDEDDGRSVHIVALENLGNEQVAVVGAMRLIEKSSDYPGSLPIENFFEDDLDIEIGEGSFEVSRLIARNIIRRRESLTRSALIGAGLAHSLANGWKPCLAVIESDVDALLNRTGIPTRQVAPARRIEKYNSVNMGVEIDTQAAERNLGRDVVNRMLLDIGTKHVILKKQDDYTRAS